jgi:hypothetical protein
MIRRRHLFAAPFVLTLACGGGRPEPSQPTPDEPGHDLPADAAMAPADPVDAAVADAPAMAEGPPAWKPPDCRIPGNPPGRGPCNRYRIINVAAVPAGAVVTIGVPNDHRLQKGQRVVLDNTSIESQLDRCDQRTCIATLPATIDQVRASAALYVVTDP